MVEQSLFAEQMDFDCIWAVEHTALTQYAHMSAPETFLAFIAGRTSRIHIGHGVVCLPMSMNHPIKVAERIATLDILSKGRLHFGVGKGGTQQEAGAFGNKLEDLTKQVDESMYMIPNIWKEEVFSYKSDLIDIPPRPIWPKPYQVPHPHMYQACTREETLITAGERGLGALVLGFSGPDEMAKKNTVYRKAYKERDLKKQVGYRPTEHFAALCPAIVLEDQDKARRIGLRGQRFFAESINYWYGGGPKPSTDDLSAEQLANVLNATKKAVVAKLGDENIPVGDQHTGMYNTNNAYGNIDDAVKYVERLEAAGADEILFLMQMGTVPHAAIMETIHNVGKYLIPYFRVKNAKKK